MIGYYKKKKKKKNSWEVLTKIKRHGTVLTERVPEGQCSKIEAPGNGLLTHEIKK